MPSYRATVKFQGFEVGEIVTVPYDHDIPEAIFKSGFLVPLDPNDIAEQKPIKQDIKIEKVVSTDPLPLD